MRARFLIWTALVLALACASGSAFEKKPSPEQLVTQAHKLADHTGIGPYVLTAQLIANPGKRGQRAEARALQS